MFKKLNKYYKSLKNHKFSILADFGDLSRINYHQMCIKLSLWNKKIIEENGNFDAEWECKNTRIRIRYNKTTSYFIQIIEEEWKPLKIIITRPQIPITIIRSF